MQEIKIPIQNIGKEARGTQEFPLASSSCASAEPFALQVLDDSMEPEFNKGCIIIIDPTGHINNHSFVLAKDPQNQYIFRQLLITANHYQLAPLNSHYPSTTIPNLKSIEGIIVQRAGKKRHYHKRYDA